MVWKYEKEIPINTLETILKTLINFGEYDYLLRLWTTKIGYNVGSKDTRPWKVFLKAITETQDVELIRLIIEKGCLLDISRERSMSILNWQYYLKQPSRLSIQKT